MPDKHEVGGSSPLKPTCITKYSTHGGVAQLGEHLPCKQGVKSSNLSVSILHRIDVVKTTSDIRRRMSAHESAVAQWICKYNPLQASFRGLYLHIHTACRTHMFLENFIQR